MRPRWVKFDWSIAVILSAVVHVGLVWWMLHDQISALAARLARGIAGEDRAYVQHHQPDDELGEDNGKGTSIANSPGDTPSSGMEADLDQPFLSRDPAGMGHVGDAPSPYPGPTGGSPMAAAMQQEVDASQAVTAMHPPDPLQPPTDLKTPVKPSQKEGTADASTTARKQTEDETPGPMKKIETSDATDVADATKEARQAVQPEVPPGQTPQSAPPQPPRQQQLAMNSPAATPGLPMRSADPAPKADSEIDPFGQKASVEFRAGKSVVRSGRKAKLTRPHIPVVGYWDGMALGRAVVALQITVDATGNVIKADVVHSSGSNEIDNPIALEAFNWWFEPNKDPAGQPVQSTFPFTVCVFH